jgi:hypothetical protein
LGKAFQEAYRIAAPQNFFRRVVTADLLHLGQQIGESTQETVLVEGVGLPVVTIPGQQIEAEQK